MAFSSSGWPVRCSPDWAYPPAIAVLVALVAYQASRFMHTHSPVLLALTVFDVAVAALMTREYRRLRALRARSMNQDLRPED